MFYWHISLFVQGLATIPVSAFYSPEHAKEFDNYIRLCFVKVNSLKWIWCEFSPVSLCCSLAVLLTQTHSLRCTGGLYPGCSSGHPEKVESWTVKWATIHPDFIRLLKLALDASSVKTSHIVWSYVWLRHSRVFNGTKIITSTFSLSSHYNCENIQALVQLFYGKLKELFLYFCHSFSVEILSWIKLTRTPIKLFKK